MLIKTIIRQQSRQSVLVALLAAVFLFAQLMAIDHDTHHPFHKHTHLCDSFASFEHSKNPLAHTSALVIAVEITSTFYQSIPDSVLHAESGVIRIRGPPLLLV